MNEHSRSVAVRARRGFVSLAVTVVILLITYACYRFAETAVSEHRAADALAERVQLAAAADSAEAFLLAELANRYAEAATPADTGQPITEENVYVNRQVGGYAGSTRVPHFSVISLAADVEGHWQHQYGLYNESARLSLSILPVWEQQLVGSSVQALMTLPGIDTETAQSLSQFILRRHASASSTEGSLRYSLDQLLEAPGMSRRLLYGDDRNYNGMTSLMESSADSSAASSMTPSRGSMSSAGLGDAAPWAALLTPYSAERNVNRLGQPRIDLNLVDLTELERQLRTRLPGNWVDFIIAYRTYGPAIATTPIAGSPAPGPIYSVYDLIGAEVRSGTASDAPPMTNPFPADRAAYRDYLFKLVDETTVDPRPVIPGRINVNLAPMAVLRAIPGVDSEWVNRIALARNRGPGDDSEQRSLAAWLVAEGWIEPAWMRELNPYITAGGDVFQAQIVSFLGPGEDRRDLAPPTRSPFIRRMVVLDAARATPRVVVRRDLSNLGRGFSMEALQQ